MNGRSVFIDVSANLNSENHRFSRIKTCKYKFLKCILIKHGAIQYECVIDDNSIKWYRYPDIPSNIEYFFNKIK